jgi:hypothetical protein
MKKIFINPILIKRLLLFVYFINIQLISQDSIIVKTIPDTIFTRSSVFKIKLIIQNNTKDTILTIKEFWPIGFSSNQLTYPMGSYYHPNIIGFSNLSKKTFITDGIYWKKYDTLPEFLAINPNDSITISIDFNDLHEFLEKYDWFVFPMLQFANKLDLDSIINEFYPTQLADYKNKIQFCNLFFYEIKIDTSYIENKQKGKYDEIKKAFK